MRLRLLTFAAVMMLTNPAVAQLAGTDSAAGDSCVGLPTGASAMTADADGDGGLTILICDGATWIAAFGGASGGNSELQFNSGGALYSSSGLVFTSAGWLGIGTDSPEASLHVMGSTIFSGGIQGAAGGNGAAAFSTNLEEAQAVLDMSYSPYPSSDIPIIGKTSDGTRVMGTFNDSQAYFAGIFDSGSSAWFGMTYDVTDFRNNGVGMMTRDTGIRLDIYGTIAFEIDEEAYIEVNTAYAFSGDISPPQITSNQNNYNPTGLSSANVLRISSDAARDITGIHQYSPFMRDGMILKVVNIGVHNITLKNQSASSTNYYRFAIGGDIVIPPERFVILMYDTSVQRWRAAL